jgi:hypothetical protein
MLELEKKKHFDSNPPKGPAPHLTAKIDLLVGSAHQDNRSGHYVAPPPSCTVWIHH